MKPCLIHGDLNPLNILLTNASDIYLIDWTFARIGDYRMDIALLSVGLLVETSWDIRNLMIELSADKGLVLSDLKYFIILSHVHILGMIYSALVNPSDGKYDIGRKIFVFKPYVHEISRLVKEITNITLPGLI